MADETKQANSQKRRLVVALDDSATSIKTLEATAKLAKYLSADLIGIFVEDQDLFSAAALPCTNIVSSVSGRIEPFSSGQLEQSVRARAGKIRSLLIEVARRHGVSWQFDIRRGPVAPELIKAAGPNAFLALSGSTRSRRHGHLGQITCTIAANAKSSVLIWSETANTTRPIVLIKSADMPADQMTETANSLSTLFNKPVETIEVAANDKENLIRQLREENAGYILVSRALLKNLGLEVRDLSAALDPLGIFIAA